MADAPQNSDAGAASGEDRLSSAAYGRDHEFAIHSPHGDWKVIVSMYASDSLTAETLVGHAKNQLVPISQRGYVWYLTEDGQRIPSDALVRCDRPREFNLAMEL